jgi:hypothetical protein
MDLDRDGAGLFARAFSPAEIAALRALLSRHKGSARLAPTQGLADFLAPATALARRFLPNAQPVFARWFDKTAAQNWSLGWHQDRTIAVRARREVPGFGQWTLKSDIPHVVPPFEFLARMLTLRLHLDDVDEANAPLLAAPGSHRLGRLAEADIPDAVKSCGTRACLAEAGDAWLYAAPILHASGRAEAPARRRVLQLAYSAHPLPGGLEWLGV